MNHKKRNILLIILLGIIIVSVIVYLVLVNIETEEVTEITPQEEITDEGLRQTIVTLYFKEKEQQKLATETRVIDAKILLENPYEILINMLIGGPKTDNLENIIPKDTKLNSVKIEKGTAILDFSKEFIENHQNGVEEEKKTIQSIVNTLTQLTEVNQVKILVEGKSDISFKDNEMSLNQIFTKSN
ncbi:MAG: GerMN domain-containing protein [Clostridia bacterium]